MGDSFVTELYLPFFVSRKYNVYNQTDKERWCTSLMNKKIYFHPVRTVLNAVNDIVELQKGRLTYSDTPHGKIHFLITMYAFEWELRFTVTDEGNGRSGVTLEIGGEKRDKEDLLRLEFALLDSMLAASERV